MSADAVLSFANLGTVVSEVSPVVVKFASKWIQTPSGLNVIAPLSFDATWARRHRPVLSIGQETHWLYTGYHVTEPHGKLVRCHQNCGVENQRYTARKKLVNVTCSNCQSRSTFEKVASGSRGLHSSLNLLCVPFPQERLRCQWFFPSEPVPQNQGHPDRKDLIARQHSRGTTHSSTPSSIAGTPPLSLPPSPAMTPSPRLEPLMIRIPSRELRSQTRPSQPTPPLLPAESDDALLSLPTISLSTALGKRRR